MNEWFFPGHFPVRSVPGVIQIESDGPGGGILVLNTVPDPENYLTYFKIDNTRFRDMVVPGITFSCQIDPARSARHLSYARKAFVGKVVMESEMISKSCAETKK